MIKIVIAVIAIFLPRRVKAFVYRSFFNFSLHPNSKIGFSFVLPCHLVMDKNSRIGHLTVIKSLTQVSLGESASIGNLNWISGFPAKTQSKHFMAQVDRNPVLIVGAHSAITNRHLIDCTDQVTIGSHSTFAGFRSQILTHSISISEARQRSGPVVIGDYAFVGTGSIFLPNSGLPSYSVLGAGSVLNKRFDESYQLYAGNPARPVKSLDRNAAYFTRATGFII